MFEIEREFTFALHLSYCSVEAGLKANVSPVFSFPILSRGERRVEE